MYLTLIILPLLGSLASGLLGRKLGTRGSQVITCTCILITTILAINAFFEVGFNNTSVSLQLFRWLDLESINIYWEFNFDSLTVSMLIPVLIVSLLVHIYSIGYMNGDPHNQRFFSYLSLFTFMMIILVTANNLLLMFVGWEGVGVCSYLLVSFWYTRIAANQSSLSAFLTNRVGDCFLTIGMFILIWTMGNIDYTTIFSLSPYINENIITLIGICLLIGAMAKSSQIGLHVWLPMAMEGPTPVSALIHAATMVTAGVYLLMRTSPLIEYSSTLLLLCLWIGAITTVFSSLIGLFQQDIKKVIAYSTMSQLGMMVIAIGLSSYNVALFHLINHAFYKGLLFLAAGSVIHAVSDNQDFRKYGGLRVFLPLTYSVMLIASLSLIAFPFMTGFYSKDFILESSYGQFYFSSFVVYYIATIGAVFTTLYSVKVLYLTFLTNPNGPISDYKSAHEGDIFMSLPLIILAIFSIFFGYITKDIFIGLGTGFFQDNSIFIHPSHEITIETEFAVSHVFKILPLINTILFTILSLTLCEFFPNILMQFKLTRLGYNIFGFFNQRFLIELFYNKYITNVALKLGGQTTKVLDKGSVEYLGPHGLSIAFTNLSKNIGKLDSSAITSYALYILSGLVFYMFINYTKALDDVIIIIVLYGFLTLTVRSNKIVEALGFHSPPKLLNVNKKNSSFNPYPLKGLIISIFSYTVFYILLMFKSPIKQYLVSNGYAEQHYNIIYLYLINMWIACFFYFIALSISYLWHNYENFRIFILSKLTFLRILLQVVIWPLIVTLVMHSSFICDWELLELGIIVIAIGIFGDININCGFLMTMGDNGGKRYVDIAPAPPGYSGGASSSSLSDVPDLCPDARYKNEWVEKYQSVRKELISKGRSWHVANREAGRKANELIRDIMRALSNYEHDIKLRNPLLSVPKDLSEISPSVSSDTNPLFKVFAIANASEQERQWLQQPRMLEGVNPEQLQQPRKVLLTVQKKLMWVEATDLIKQELILEDQRCQKLILEQQQQQQQQQWQRQQW